MFRARTIDGPYEVRTVLAQGTTPINGPHQGAWVRAGDGRDWFLHFQDKGAFGRVVHLEPMRWKDDWPLIGEPGPKADTGQPVLTHAKPVAGFPLKAPATSDEFDGSALGLQWQWSANPQVVLADAPSSLVLRMQRGAGAAARFSYSADGIRFTSAGTPFGASKGRWVGAQVGLFSVGSSPASSYLDVDYFRVASPDRMTP